MSEHILIIEDDLDIANIERDYLMVAGYDLSLIHIFTIYINLLQVFIGK